jgi:GT2 family glycosyltransferase
MAPDISIVVLNYNTRDLLADCLESIIENLNGLDAELVVVDNASDDGSADMVESQYPQAFLVKNHTNEGFSSGINNGIRAASADYILVLNQDTLVKPGSLERMVGFLEGNGDAGIVGPKLLSANGTYQQSCNYFTVPSPKNALLLLMGMVLPRGKKLGTYCADPWSNGNGSVEVDWIHGACMLVRKEVFGEAGLFDENFFVYMEDMEFCYRARKKGWKTVYLPQAEIVHLTNQSGIQNIGKLYSYKRLRFYVWGIDYFLRKHFNPVYSYFTLLFLAIGALSASIVLRLALLLGLNSEETRKKIVYSQRLGMASAAGLLSGIMPMNGNAQRKARV